MSRGIDATRESLDRERRRVSNLLSSESIPKVKGQLLMRYILLALELARDLELLDDSVSK